MGRIAVWAFVGFFVQSAVCASFCWVANFSPPSLSESPGLASLRDVCLQLGRILPKAYIASEYFSQKGESDAAQEIFSTTGFSFGLFVSILAIYSIIFWITRASRIFYDQIADSSVQQLARLEFIHRIILMGIIIYTYYFIIGFGPPVAKAGIFPEENLAFALIVPVLGFSVLFASIYYLSNSWISVKNQIKAHDSI